MRKGRPWAPFFSAPAAPVKFCHLMQYAPLWSDFASAYAERMGLTIYINWEYFLGVIGALIGLAYYANGRFTKIETTLEWMKETLQELKANSVNHSCTPSSSRATVRRVRHSRH